MKTIALVSQTGECLSLARKLFGEGNRVIFCNMDKTGIGEGLIDTPKIENLGDLLKHNPDLILFGSVHPEVGKVTSQLIEKGYLTLGGSHFGSMLELSPQYFKVVCKQCKLTYSDDVGDELCIGIWFNGRDVLDVYYAVEDTTLMDGNLGPRTDSMGTIVWGGSAEDKIFKRGIGKFVEACARSSFKGVLSLRVSITKEEVFLHEARTSFKHIPYQALCELYRGRLTDLLFACASGVTIPIPSKSKVFAGIVKTVVPLFPYGDDKPNGNAWTFVNGVDKECAKHFWFGSLAMVDGRIMCIGSSGKIGEVSAWGESIREVRRRCYRTINHLAVKDLMYRLDVGDRAQELISNLSTWGWM